MKIDSELRRVIHHEAPKPASSPTLERASRLLSHEAARREAHFRNSAEEERMKQARLERKFEEALRRNREAAGADLPSEPPGK